MLDASLHEHAAPTHREQGRPDLRRGRPLRVTRHFAVSTDRVFAAWLDPGIARRWLFATAAHPLERAEVDVRVAGGFRFVHCQSGRTVVHAGRYLEIVPPRRLAFSLRVETFDTRVSVEIAPAAIGCRLALTHEHVPPQLASATRARWHGILYGLGETLAAIAEAGSETPNPPIR